MTLVKQRLTVLIILAAAAIVPTQQMQAALHDALKGTQNIEQSAALNRCRALCVTGISFQTSLSFQPLFPSCITKV